MLHQKSLLKSFFVLILSVILLSACQENESVTSQNSGSTDIDVFQKIIAEDELLESFEANYEDDAMLNSLAKFDEEITPINIRRKIVSRERELELTVSEDEQTATGVAIKTITGILYIKAETEDGNSSFIEKSFTSIVTRNLEFEKYANSDNPEKNWRIIKMSLAEGSTGSENIEITKLTLFMPDNSIIEIDSPNDYYLERIIGKRNQVPKLKQRENITVKVEVKSVYEGDDYLCLNYGATKNGLRRAKQKFELLETTRFGEYFNKVYEATYTTNKTKGKKHAVVNLISNLTLHDSESVIESNSWGIPYIVN
ncbi:MAG: hypothetical protein JEY94_10750 [Melioribacteraceae bacterium]|nr:hypothetical protein [Melioribacteraceae bacterium]